MTPFSRTANAALVPAAASTERWEAIVRGAPGRAVSKRSRSVAVITSISCGLENAIARSGPRTCASGVALPFAGSTRPISPAALAQATAPPSGRNASWTAPGARAAAAVLPGFRGSTKFSAPSSRAIARCFSSGEIASARTAPRPRESSRPTIPIGTSISFTRPSPSPTISSRGPFTKTIAVIPASTPIRRTRRSVASKTLMKPRHEAAMRSPFCDSARAEAPSSSKASAARTLGANRRARIVVRGPIEEALGVGASTGGARASPASTSARAFG